MPRAETIDRADLAPLYVRPRRDLGEQGLWERSLARSEERRRRSAAGAPRRRSIVSAALVDLDGPLAGSGRAADLDRDLAADDLWRLSDKVARAKRRAVQRPVLDQARAASASLVVAAVAATLPVQGSAQSRAGKAAAAQVDSRLLRVGSRGPAVADVQRALGIAADGIFGPKTRAAVRDFQARHGLLVDGIVGQETRAALARAAGGGGSAERTFTAPWVAPVQRKLGIPADGVFGPQTRAAVKAFQARSGLVVDGIVGPQTLAALGLSVPAGPATGGAAPSGGGASATSSSSGLTALRAAMRQIGAPYAWGGESPGGFDCSGLVQWSFRQAGVSLPRTSHAQLGAGRRVARGDVRAGDLVFFSTNGPGASHVGIAVSAGSFVSATGHGVRIQPIGGDYWGRSYVGARRVA